MNKIIVFISCLLCFVFIDLGLSASKQLGRQKENLKQIKENNAGMRMELDRKERLSKQRPMLLSQAYSLLMNQAMILQAYSGTQMNIQLEGFKDTDDITQHYVDTIYKGVKGLKIKIVVDKFSKETDMGAVLDDIHLLEKNTDFLATEINKENNDVTVKGEIYGL